jgi:hypothetical protein
VYETLPVVDWAVWSRSGEKRAGMWPVLVSGDGTTSPLRAEGTPVVKELNATGLSVVQALKGGGTFSILCAEREVTLRCVDQRGRPLNYACRIVGGESLKRGVRSVKSASVVYSHSGVEYRLKLGAGSGRALADGSVELTPDRKGKLVMMLDSGSIAAMDTRSR